MQKKQFKIFGGLLFVLILTISLISAVGVVRPYWDDNPLKLAPGESKIVVLTLQNTGPEDITLKAIIDSEIATLADKDAQYIVPSGEINQPVNIKVEIPKDAEAGKNYKITASFQQVSLEEGGMISFTGALIVDFPVEVVSLEESELYRQPEPPKSMSIFWILLSLIIATIIVIFLVKKKGQKIRKK